jgi:hypothetical protein
VARAVAGAFVAGAAGVVAVLLVLLLVLPFLLILLQERGARFRRRVYQR